MLPNAHQVTGPLGLGVHADLFLKRLCIPGPGSPPRMTTGWSTDTQNPGTVFADISADEGSHLGWHRGRPSTRDVVTLWCLARDSRMDPHRAPTASSGHRGADDFLPPPPPPPSRRGAGCRSGRRPHPRPRCALTSPVLSKPAPATHHTPTRVTPDSSTLTSTLPGCPGRDCVPALYQDCHFDCHYLCSVI